jgi:hypothetical protein
MLITVAEAAEALSIAATDPRLIRLCTSTDQWAKRQLGRRFERGTYELYAAGYGGRNPVWLRESPIIELIDVRVSSVSNFDDDSIVDASRFRFNPEMFADDNRLYFLDGRFPDGPKTVYVKGVFGWWPADYEAHASEVPADLSEALIERVVAIYREGGGDEEMESQSQGDRSWTKFEQTDTRILKKLRKYKR